MHKTPPSLAGRAPGRGASSTCARAARLTPLGALGLGFVQLTCSRSEPQPSTPQTEPSALVTTANAGAANAGAPDNGATFSVASAAAGTSPSADAPAPTALPVTTSRWPSANSAPPNVTPGQPTAAPDATLGPTGITALATNRESSQITGCLAAAPPNQSPTRAAPSKSSGGETWRATALGNGVLVTHRFEHACCLKGSATATVTGSAITVEEQLIGQPCRCVCESTIQTRVPAPPGEYDVQSVTVTNGRRRVVQTARVRIGVAQR